MPIIPDPPFPKSQGDNIRSKDWNDVVNEVIRLDNAKLNLAGGTITGPLQLNGPLTVSAGQEVLVRGAAAARVVVKADGKVGIGVDNPIMNLHVADSMTIGNAIMPPAPGRFVVSGSVAEIVFTRRTLGAAAPVAAGDRFLWYNDGGIARLFTDGPGDLVTVSPSGQMAITQGSLALGSIGINGSDNPRRLNVSMGFAGFIGAPLNYQFQVGHNRLVIVGQDPFVRVFSVDQAGNAFFAGGKGGYVVDYFVNAVGGKVERGDVVVLAQGGATLHYGTQNNIPIPEVDLCSREYDTRVCGIVADFVLESDLPTVAAPPDAGPEFFEKHPFAGMGGPPEQQVSVVEDRQLGRMVTLGSYAHCKADAAFGAIETGDLLTTSTTPGHARKVDNPARALGTIIGKALAPLSSGRGVIPILVMLQ